jgi:predicted O-methyltransferase YrrM
MAIKSLNAARPMEQRAWKLLQGLVPHRFGWYYEGCPDFPGQMWYADRKALYETIRRFHPLTVCENGTWLGGGSTYFIAQALHDNGEGILQTTEASPEFFQAAVQGYHEHLSRLRPFVNFNFGGSLAIYPGLLKTLGKVDAVLLDGAEDGGQVFAEFHLFEPYLGPDSIVMAHD